MFKEKLKLIPHLPGSYQMKNSDDIIIYVGKAKDLNKRVNSYFNRPHTGKTAKMVSEIADFEYIVASSELEAFLLEFNLIKHYDPKYNILLKDDKSYPYIEYIKTPYPRLQVSRYLNIRKKDKKLLFGPYPNAYAARRIVSLINRLYPLKKCDSMPKKVCLYYHIGECLGYCEKKPDSEKLALMEEEILSFLRGNGDILKNKIIEKMNLYSSNLNFEMALELKKELDYISIVLDKQKMELHDYTNRDVIGYYFNKGHLSIQILFLRNGRMVGGHTDIFPVIGEYQDELDYYIMNFYSRHEIPKEILVPNEVNTNILAEIIKTNLSVPIKGKKKNLLDMASLNAKINLENELEIIEKDEEKTEVANNELKEILGLKKLDRIDLFDNSNLFGNFTVSCMVVFKNGRPAKKEYRKYKISLDKNDDYHTMEEVIYRRYYRALVDKTELPDLIIVDGGINQINACLNILNELNLKVRVCGLRKNDKHRTNDLIDSNGYRIIELDKTSAVFHYLTRMQDEVHRYTISYHRTIRSKGAISSVLDNIEGIGAKRKKELIKTFGSVNKMLSASIEELSEIIPTNVAINLKEYLNTLKSEQKNNK
ncbi:MAG: excinuclease ABC subunit UvrC [Bacilli bacterium]|jgi:excinuclease ABC subunit C|nr:excinuclease ABC subunit UvrC [Bacilli bacterium]MCX4254137.1 excinuclease ABC subunit UvrC [Bacilli bacterium]